MNWRSLLFAAPFIVVILVLVFSAGGTAKIAMGSMAITCPVWMLLVINILCTIVPLGLVTDDYGDPLLSRMFGSQDFRRGVRSAMVGLAIIFLIILASIAIQTGKLPWGVLPCALLLVFAAIASAHALDALERGSPLGFESHWGGLGGGSGGWRLLPATGAAILALSFTGAAIAVGFGAFNKIPSSQSTSSTTTGKTNDAVAAGAAVTNAAAGSDAAANAAAAEVDKTALRTDRPKLPPPPSSTANQAPAVRPAP